MDLEKSRNFEMPESIPTKDDQPLDQSLLSGQSSSDLNIGKNSRTLTTFLLLNTILGSGVLNQPEVYKKAGILIAFILSVFAAYLIWLGVVILIDLGYSHSKSDYSELAIFAFGSYGKYAVDISIVIGNFGAIMSYILIIGDTAATLLHGWGCHNEVGCSFYLMVILFTVIFILPICSMRIFGHLAIYSVMSIISLTCITLLTLIGGPIVGDGSKANLANGYGFLTQFGSIVYALSFAFASFHNYNSLLDANPKSWREVSYWSVVIALGFCVTIGLGIVITRYSIINLMR
jgi:sodium-coupled neutral amino acid transporter 2